MYVAWSRSLMYRGPPPNLPAFVFFIKIAILAIAVVVLYLAAYADSVFNSYLGLYYYSGGAAGLLIFVAIKTFIIHGGSFVIEHMYPHLLYRSIVLALYVVSAIFWLSAWSYAASSARAWLTVYSWWVKADGDDDPIDDAGDYWRNEGIALAVCAALGAVAWILTVVLVYYYNLACYTDPEVVAAVSAAPQYQAELGQAQVQPQQQTQPQAQTYREDAYPKQ